MKKIFLLFIFLVFFSQESSAAKLSEALSQAYKNNPILNAERENINISKENINVSKSKFLPSLSITGTKSQEDTKKLTNQNGSNATIKDTDPLVKSFLIEQTLYDGNNRNSDLEKNKIGLELAKNKILKTEQDIFLKAIEAYTGLALAQKKLIINEANISLLNRQVDTDRARLERGQITISDLAQSESSLAGAKAELIKAQNNVTNSLLLYENIIGPIKLSNFKESNDIKIDIPSSLSEANEISILNDPNLIIAKLEFEQSKKDIKIANSNLLPTATLSFEASQTDDLSSTYDEREKATLKATLKWPFYSGGKNRSLINKNKNINNQKRLLLDSALKTNKASVSSSWANFQFSKSLLESMRSQVKAAQMANEGIIAEYESGVGRSTLDVIQSNSILLNAKISLADSERDYLLSKFQILQSIGLLTNRHLKIE